MCVNMRWVKSPYQRTSIFVPCGKCPACLQEKANKRVQRIHANSRKGYVNLFVTLTYRNEFIPYLKRSELDLEPQELNIYRDSYVEKRRLSSTYSIGYKITKGTHVVDTITVDSSIYNNFNSNFLLDCKKSPGHISVCYYKDIQDFFKRLRINLKRHYNYEKSFSYFQCSEYGSKSHRAHFHSLLSVPFEDIEIFKSAICESWPFDSEDRKRRSIEIARNAASYVASYVNCISSIDSFLAQNCFKPKHSYSQGYGMAIPDFSLDKIEKKVQNGTLEYSTIRIRDRVPEVVNLPIPKYVVNKYFPKFVGYSRLTSDQVYELLSHPRRYASYSKFLNRNKDDLHREIVKIENAYQRYKAFKKQCPGSFLNPGFSRFDFAIDYLNTWHCLERTKLRRFYLNIDMLPLIEQYDNIGCVATGLINAPTIVPLLDFDAFNKNPDLYDPNSFPSRYSKSVSLYELFLKKDKTRRVVNECYTSLGYNF